MRDFLEKLITMYPNKNNIVISPEDLAVLREELELSPEDKLDSFLGKNITVSLDQIIVDIE